MVAILNDIRLEPTGTGQIPSMGLNQLMLQGFKVENHACGSPKTNRQ